jgi:D-sedoheptulose 7-phosphate isomerase
MRHKRLQACIEKHPALETCATDIELAGELLKQTFEEGGKLLLCGNGGSAADSDHIAGELLKGFDSKRHLAPEWREKLGDSLADNLQTGLPVIPLTGFNALSTAYANDCDGQYTFAQLAFALGQSGDALMGISTSGNSANVLHALKTARAMEMSTIGLTGESGGQLAGLADCCIRVPSSVVWEIQELHLPVYHTLCLMLEDHFFSEAD